ncbi:MAG: methyltransferase domain-containing protein [Synergistetes bacterium]|nr:methyltransferase domain-containing protein [Synergistota bacterium]
MNWNELWQRSASLFVVVDERGSLKDWDEKGSHRLGRFSRGSHFVKEALRRIKVSRSETVLDVGSGPGTLAVPLAKISKSVTALDMSEEMLSRAREYAREEKVDNIAFFKGKWQDVIVGKDISIHDVVLVSRSLEMISAVECEDQGKKRLKWDLKGTLIKLNEAAKKRVYIICSIFGNQPYEEKLYKIFGGEYDSKPNYIYVYNTLYDLGIYANVEIVDSGMGRRYGSFEDALGDWIWRLNLNSEDEIRRLRYYLLKFLTERNGFLTWRVGSNIRWAFIWWERK